MYVELHLTRDTFCTPQSPCAEAEVQLRIESITIHYMCCQIHCSQLKKNMHTQYLIGTNKHAFRKYVSIQKSLRYVVYIGNVVVV